MAEGQIGYRALPSHVAHPSNATILTRDQFDEIRNKEIIQSAPSLCENHEGTIIWYTKERGYIVEIKLKSKASFCVLSLCTVEPTFGMDLIDGHFAQDIEAYILFKELGCHTDRLNIFTEKEMVEITTYLQERGFGK